MTYVLAFTGGIAKGRVPLINFLRIKIFQLLIVTKLLMI